MPQRALLPLAVALATEKNELPLRPVRDNADYRFRLTETGQVIEITVLSIAVIGIAVTDGLRRGELVWLLPAWYVARLVIYAAMPTRRLVPAKTRAFMDFMRSLYGDGTSDPWLAEREAGVVPSAISLR